MALTTSSSPGTGVPRGPRGARDAAARRGDRRFSPVSRAAATGVLLLGALYCLLPLFWVVAAASKTPEELFSTSTLVPGSLGGLLSNIADLSAYRGGEFWRWGLNTLLYAGVGSVLSVGVSAAAGFALAKYRFHGRTVAFDAVLGAVLLPQIVLAVPQYLLISKLGMADTYWSVLLPTILSPYGIYLLRVYAASAVPDEMLEAARIDGASELRIFRSIALPTMLPGLVTAFLLQFVASWNTFLLPYVMLADDRKFPMTVGLFTMLNQGANQPVLYSLVIAGALLSIMPLVALFLFLQKFWSVDLVSGAVKA